MADKSTGDLFAEPAPVELSLVEKIRQRRAQMLVHSFIYYRLNDNVVSDHDWQRWANELVELQALHPEGIGFYDEEFIGWDGSTGYHLPNDPWVHSKAMQLLEYHYKHQVNDFT